MILCRYFFLLNEDLIYLFVFPKCHSYIINTFNIHQRSSVKILKPETSLFLSGGRSRSVPEWAGSPRVELQLSSKCSDSVRIRGVPSHSGAPALFMTL